MKKTNKLYNLILPPYMLMVFIPWLAILSIIGNFVVDSIILGIVSFSVFKYFDMQFYRKNVLKVWALGFVADFIGVLYLFLGSEFGYIYLNIVRQDDGGFFYKLMDSMNNVTNHSDIVTGYSVCFIFSAVLIASIAIFLLDYFIVFRKADMTKKQKVLSALSFAIFTAPYTFLLPSNLFY